MSKKAQLFIGLTIASGIILVASCAARVTGVSHSRAYLGCCLLALLASTMKIHLPGMTGTLSLNFLFILVAVAAFTFPETVLLASLACILQCVWKARRRPRIVQVSFNVAALAISSGASYRISHLLVTGRNPSLSVLLAIAACLYFTANTLLVSGVLSLVEGKSLFQVWQQCYLWSFPYYLVGAAMAGLIVSTERSMGWAMSLLIAPCMYLVYVFYRICVERLGRQPTAGIVS